MNALSGALPATACRPFRWLLQAALLGLLCCASLHAAEPPLRALYGLVDERLELMKAVALYKRAHQLPVEDLKREQAIIDYSAKLTRHHNEMTAADLLPLREAGLSDLEILDVTQAAAMFAWANRLMLTLGEPERIEQASGA